MRQPRLPETGIWIVEGLPGAGKSYYLVREILRLILVERRPVYTNLPLVWPLIRVYLRKLGGEDCSKLLHELTEDHFRRFCRRQAQRAKFLSEHKSFRRDRGRTFARCRLDQMWFDQAGPDVLAAVRDSRGEPIGDPPNWIPGVAVVVIDEVHEWFSMENQRDEDPALLAYLTKHRHHQHLVMVASQNKMQVALPFRRNASRLIAVRNKGDDRVAWSIRWRHLGIRAIGVSVYNAEIARTTKDTEGHLTLEDYAYITTLPWNQVYFRLYRSFTHMGSPAELRRQLERSRQEAGLTPAVIDVGPEKKEGWSLRKATKAAVSWVFWFLFRWTVRFVVLGIVGLLAFSVGRWGRVDLPKEVRIEEVSTGGRAGPASEPDWPRWTATGDSWVRLGSERVRLDQVHRGSGARLVHLSSRPRALLLDHAGVCYAWVWPEAKPRRLGPWPEVGRAVYATAVRRLESDGGSGSSQSSDHP